MPKRQTSGGGIMRLARTKSWLLLSLLLPVLAAGCAGNGSTASDNTAADEPAVPVTKEVLQAYDDYLQRHLPLAFAIGADGRGYGYVYCDGMHCTPAPQARADAVSDCNEG